MPAGRTGTWHRHVFPSALPLFPNIKEQEREREEKEEELEEEESAAQARSEQ